MEEQCSPLGWAYYYQEDGVDELKQSLLYSTLELEAALISAHDDISRKDDEILQLKALLSKIIKERDELQAKSRDLAREKKLQLLEKSSNQHLDTTCPISSGTTSDDQGDRNIDMPPSDCDGHSIVAATGCKDTLPPHVVHDVTETVALKRALPEQGKLLQAVMDAGPLLQTLLLAGPLPQWQHPPPQLNSTDIPPVTIPSPTATKMMASQDSSFIIPITNKRAMVNWDGSDFSPSAKYQKVCSPIYH